MATYERPDIYIEEQTGETRPIQGVTTAVTCFHVVAKRGPINFPVFIGSLDEYKRVFGPAVAGQAGYYALKGFFENKGRQAYVNRLGHYSDPADATSLVAEAASLDMEGLGIAAAAKFVGSVSLSSVNLRAVAASGAATLTFSINGGGNKVVTFAANQALLTGAGGAFGGTLAGGETFTIRINDGVAQVITLAAGDDASVEAAAAKIASQLLDASVGVTGGQLRIKSDRYGNTSKVQITAAHADIAGAIGLSVAVDTEAASSCADAQAVTFAELKTLVEAAVKTATPGDLVTLTQVTGGFGKITVTDVSGGEAGTSIDLSAGTAGLITALGLTGLGTQGANDAANGTAASADTAFTIKAGYRGRPSPGLDGNNLKVSVTDDPIHPSLGVTKDFAVDAASDDSAIFLKTSNGLAEGSILRLSNGVDTEYVIVTSITTTAGASVTHRIGLASALVYDYTVANGTVASVEHTVRVYDGEKLIDTWKQVSVNPEADNYILTAINDVEVGSIFAMVEDAGLTFPANVLQAFTSTALAGGTDELSSFADADVLGDATAKTGLYAGDVVSDMNLLSVPPSFGGVTTIKANSVIHNAMLAYAGRRADCFALLDAPEKLSPAVAPLLPTHARTYRNEYLGVDSMWGALYYPFVEVSDPLGVGKNPKVLVPPSGHVAGIFARVDAIKPPEGGVATAPSGVGDFGKVAGVSGLAYYVSDQEHDILNPAGVNAIRKFSRGGPEAPGIVLFGARTLSLSKAFRYIQIRRLFTYVEQSVRIGTRWAVFRNNDFRTWGRVENQVKDFLIKLHKDGQLAGKTAKEAFFVRVNESTTTPQHVEDGQLVGEIGLAGQKPAEFLVFKFSQFEGGTNITE